MMDSKLDKPLEGEILDGAEEKIAANEKRVHSGFWKKLAVAADKIPFIEEVVAGYYCALDPATPQRVRAMLLAALAYFILPLDSIPDFLLGFGFTDDIAVLTAVLGAIRGNIRHEHRRVAREKLAEFREQARDQSDSSAS